MPAGRQKCQHESLSFQSTAEGVYEFKRPNEEKRLAAATPTGRVRASKARDDQESFLIETYPGPLLLPGDDLTMEDESPQSLLSWLREKERNPVTPSRHTIYLAAPPAIAVGSEHIARWINPSGVKSSLPPPSVDTVLAYLQAFFHPLPVQLFSTPKLSFSSPSSKSKSIKLLDHSVATRPSPSSDFSVQLSLNDLLDVAIGILPPNAYALLLLVNHDLFEDADDEFVCGRAYGGSRVAVISSARYNPALDNQEGIDRTHAWPASHCTAYEQELCNGAEPQPTARQSKKQPKRSQPEVIDFTLPAPARSMSPPSRSPMHAALDAFTSSTPSPSALWLSRVCRTSSHELGHCFGIAHCAYYACCMQGSACLNEDARQPPYLCPVDEAKVRRAVADGSGRAVSKEERDGVMLAFCEGVETGGGMFEAWAAWLRAQM